MKKVFIIICGIAFFSCENDSQKTAEIDNSVVPDSSKYLTYSQMKDILSVTKEYIQKNSDFSINSANKFDKISTIEGFNQIIELIDGLEIQSQAPMNKMGAPIDTAIFSEGVRRMKKHIGLGILYRNENIRGFEILRKDIEYLTKDTNYYSIRAYPLMHSKETKNTLTYALIAVKKNNPIKLSKEQFYTDEDLNTLSDTWDPWPPRNTRLSQDLKNKTLLRYY